MPRVASEASAVHHHALNSRRPAAAEAKQPSTPFSALLDDGAPPPSPRDHAERPQPSSSQGSSSQASSTQASSSQASQPDKGTRRGQDNADDGNHIDSAGTQQPAADTKTEANNATDAKAGDAKAADGSDQAGQLAPAGATDTAALAAASDASAPQPVAVTPVPAATAPDGAALVAVIDTPAASQPGASEPVPAATDPAAAVPAADAAANSTDAAAAAKGAGVAAADALSAQAQGAATADTGTTSAADGKDQTGRKAASNGADGISNASKSRTAKLGTGVANLSSSRTEADASAGPADPQGGDQAGAQAGAQAGSQVAQAGSNPVGKGEPGHHASRTQDAAEKSGETRLQADVQAGAAADKLPSDAAQLASLQHPADRFANLVSGTVHAGAAANDPTAVPIAGLAVEIAARAQAGSNRFDIRLDPPELGRIDVRLDIDRDGQVTSRLLVEKAETLDLLRRDAPELERALQQAGLKTSDSGLQFTLRDQSFGWQNQGTPDNSSPSAAKLVVADPEMTPVGTVPGAYGGSLRLGTGIDIRV